MRKTTKTRMKKRQSRNNTHTLRIMAAILLAAILAFAAYRILTSHQQGGKAEAVMNQLESIIPGLGQDTCISTGQGRDPLAAVSIEGTDIVGVLEIPSMDIQAPVISGGMTEDEDAESGTEPWFASHIGGSPVQGHFMLAGNKADLFSGIAGLAPGDKVAFTDIDGVRYNYTVMTQYHLKKWDTGDNDLLLCTESDDDTYFVVGCSEE